MLVHVVAKVRKEAMNPRKLRKRIELLGGYEETLKLTQVELNEC
jgi:hypothetical protein